MTKNQDSKPTSAPLFLIKTALIVMVLWGQSVTAESLEDLPPPESVVSEAQQLHTDLMLAAIRADLYNTHCRGTSIAKNFNQVNRLFITKYSLTANKYIKTYINKLVNVEKGLQEREFKMSLNKIGGCRQAKKRDWRTTISGEFKNLYRQVKNSTWYPEEL